MLPNLMSYAFMHELMILKVLFYRFIYYCRIPANSNPKPLAADINQSITMLTHTRCCSISFIIGK